MGRVISVVSGKGGAGKTTVSGSVASALAALGKSVMLIDGDFESGNLDLILGISEGIVFNLIDILQNDVDFDRAARRIDDKRELYFISSCVTREATGEEAAAKIPPFLEDMRVRFDYVVIDCPAGVGSAVKAFVAGSDIGLIVASPDMTTVRDAQRVAGLLESAGRKAFLVANKVRPKQIAEGKAPDIDYLIDMTGAQLIGLIPDDGEIPALRNAGTLPVNKNGSASGRQMTHIARRIAGERLKLEKFW